MTLPDCSTTAGDEPGMPKKTTKCSIGCAVPHQPHCLEQSDSQKRCAIPIPDAATLCKAQNKAHEWRMRIRDIQQIFGLVCMQAPAESAYHRKGNGIEPADNTQESTHGCREESVKKCVHTQADLPVVCATCSTVMLMVVTFSPRYPTPAILHDLTLL